MYIEFSVPDCNDTAEKSYILWLVKQQIAEWQDQYRILPKQKTVKFRHRLCFEEDKLYNFFLLTFDPGPYSEMYQMKLINDLNNR